MHHVSLISLFLIFSIIYMDLAEPVVKRTLHYEEKCKNTNWTTMYLKANGTNDTLHYIWDFGGKPSILMALTSVPTTLSIDCKDFSHRRNNSIVFSEDPIYTFGIIMNKIIEFNDVKDRAVINFTNSTNINVLKSESFLWSRKSFSMNDDFFNLNMESKFYNDTTTKITRRGSIQVSLKGYNSLDHTGVIPHMLHSENSMLVDVIFDDIEINATFTSSRFAVELMIVGGGNPDKSIIIDAKKNLDDEHTPGIFKEINVKTPPFNKTTNESESNCAYLQWRPISYTSSSRSISSSTEMMHYPSFKVYDRVAAIQNSMLYCYHGEDVEDVLVETIMISIGSRKDGFYNSTRYQTWTFLIGLGTPLEEQLSFILMIVLLTGLCLPVAIMTLAAFYACIRNKMSRRDTDDYLDR